MSFLFNMYYVSDYLIFSSVYGYFHPMKNSELTSLLDHLASKVYKSKVNNVKWLLPISIENPIERNDQLGQTI